MSTRAVASSLEQRMGALDKANAVRIARAQLFRELKQLSPDQSRERAAFMLEHPMDCLLSLPVFRFLTNVHRVGSHKSGSLLRRANLSPLRPIGALTPRQRMDLASALRKRAW